MGRDLYCKGKCMRIFVTIKFFGAKFRLGKQKTVNKDLKNDLRHGLAYFPRGQTVRLEGDEVNLGTQCSQTPPVFFLQKILCLDAET